MKTKLILTAALFAVCLTRGQRGYQDSNHIGIGIGMNQYSLATDDFSTKPGTGWNAGLSVRGNFYNDFDMVYGIQFAENNFTVETLGLGGIKDVDFKLSSAQISLLLSYKIIENHLSVELGPMVQVNGNYKIAESDELNIVSGTLVTAKDLTEISRFTFYPTIGITAGIKHVRIHLAYQYGVTNTLAALDGDFKGHASILSGTLLVYL